MPTNYVPFSCWYPGCDKPAEWVNEGGLWCEHPHPITPLEQISLEPNIILSDN